MKFQTELTFKDRVGRAAYVADKYRSILTGSVLDVGADECHLKKHLPEDVKYWGIGLGGNPDQEVNLETEKIPFQDGEFEIVMCLEVLEHLENIHEIFDELCRVSSNYVLISLPTPWVDLYSALCWDPYSESQTMKFYGLPLERPVDRHKWFFSYDEAEAFLRHRAAKNNMQVVELAPGKTREVPVGWKRPLRALARKILFRRNLDQRNLFQYTVWCVLQKSSSV